MEPIQRQKVSDQVLTQIKNMIKNGHFPHESKLPSENELAKLFHVSRSPVREALSVLAASGIIESRQGGGSYVKSVSLSTLIEDMAFEFVEIDEVLDLLEMRMIIETEAAGLAAIRHNHEEINELEKALFAFRKTLEDEESVGDEADYNFHKVLVKATNNPFLLQSFENLSNLHQKALAYSLKLNIGFRRKREMVYNEHFAIFEAIKNRDSQLAKEKMRLHLSNAYEKLKSYKDESISVKKVEG